MERGHCLVQREHHPWEGDTHHHPAPMFSQIQQTQRAIRLLSALESPIGQELCSNGLGKKDLRGEGAV